MDTGVYCIKNKVNGKMYIGSTADSFYGRFATHKNFLKNKKHHSIYLQNAWNKYGEENFEFIIISGACLRKIPSAYGFKWEYI